jgi:hypothetical protein
MPATAAALIGAEFILGDIPFALCHLLKHLHGIGPTMAHRHKFRLTHLSVVIRVHGLEALLALQPGAGLAGRILRH